MDIEKQLNNTVRHYAMFKKKDRLLIGVSGGPDSVCLLRLLSGLKEHKLDLICLHFNHALRREADQEEKFVKKLCRQLGVRCLTGKKDVKKGFKGDSLEQTARNMRFDFFNTCARQFRTRKIALAHNKDDAAETVIMRIIRGTALKGLRGILPVSRNKGLTIVRPLLEVSKKDIVEWLKKNKYDYMVDASNQEEVFLRNKVRLSLLPSLKKINPNISGALFNLGRVSALDYECIEYTARQELGRLKKEKGRGYIRIEHKSLLQLHPGLVLNVLRLAVEEIKGDTRRLEFRHFEEVLDLLRHRPLHSVVDLPGLSVIKEERWLTIKSLLF